MKIPNRLIHIFILLSIVSTLTLSCDRISSLMGADNAKDNRDNNASETLQPTDGNESVNYTVKTFCDDIIAVTDSACNIKDPNGFGEYNDRFEKLVKSNFKNNAALDKDDRKRLPLVLTDCLTRLYEHNLTIEDIVLSSDEQADYASMRVRLLDHLTAVADTTANLGAFLSKLASLTL